MREALAALAAEGYGDAIIDAIFDRHLETIGEAVLDNPLSTGASGLGLGLARALVARGRVTAASAAAINARRRLVMPPSSPAVAPAPTLEQIAVAEHAMPVLPPSTRAPGDSRARPR